MLKRILLFDVNRILFFDVNRILFWDISRAVIPSMLLKAVLGAIAAALLVPLVALAAFPSGWVVQDWVVRVAMIAGAVLAIASELRPSARARRRA